ncbi:MAG: LemA family protein [Candidatus Saganbacteria bacterium]|nr:LemA family protein [Candidatus Saganbacteria bacterium]
MKNKWLIAIGIALVLIVLWMGGLYNSLVGVDQQVAQSWSEIQNQLQRRNDLIPNLIETVKGYAKHEKTIFIEVAEARTKLAGALSGNNMDDKISAAQGLNSSLGRLIAIAENYPQLKANETFVRLMDELSGTENRIAVARMRYNESVQTYNNKVKTVPTVFFVSMFGFDRSKPYFEAVPEAKETPKVKF